MSIVPVGRMNLDAGNIRFGGITQTYTSPIQCNCVAFRFDSFQDYYLSAGEQAVLQAFQNYGAPLTISVIAQNFGQDPNLLAKYSGRLGDFKHGIEIATSGLVGADYLFLPLTSQNGDLSSAVRLIKTNFGQTVKTFTPLFGDYSIPDIYSVCNNSNIQYFSSVVRADHPPFTLVNPPGGLWHLSAGAFTANPSISNTTNPPAGYTATQIFSQIKAQMQRDGFSVVSMTSLEFSVFSNGGYLNDQANMTMIQTLQTVLSMIQSAGIHISVVSDIPGYVGTSGNPIYKNPATNLYPLTPLILLLAYFLMLVKT